MKKEPFGHFYNARTVLSNIVLGILPIICLLPNELDLFSKRAILGYHLR